MAQFQSYVGILRDVTNGAAGQLVRQQDLQVASRRLMAAGELVLATSDLDDAGTRTAADESANRLFVETQQGRIPHLEIYVTEGRYGSRPAGVLRHLVTRQ
jgi:hypothetical protein